MLAIRAEALEGFRALCVRERCPFAVVGRATRDDRLIVEDPEFANRPVDMELSVLLGKPPKMTRDVAHVRRELPAFDPSGIDLREAAYRVLQFPAVADKTFLVTIGDRTVGGLCSRDSMVGPWQVPVADVAMTLMDFDAYAGEAIAMGERTPLALIDAPASGRMAIGEALTNLAAAGVEGLREVKLSANWMAAAGHPGEDGPRGSDGALPGARGEHSGGQGFDVDAHGVARRRHRQGSHGAGVVDRVGVRARCRRAACIDSATAARSWTDGAAVGRPG